MSPLKEIKGFFRHYRWLSNFWECDISLPDGITYPSVEVAYQAQKFPDSETRIKIADMSSKEAKEFGKTAKLPKNWDTRKLSVMETLLRVKLQNKELRNLLLDTGDAYLEETNYWKDTFWGVCDGVGENHLGKILMKIRKEIKEQQSKGE